MAEEITQSQMPNDATNELDPQLVPQSDQLESTDTRPMARVDIDADTLPMPSSAVAEEPYIQVAQRCDVGLFRQRNEDSTFVFNAQSGGEIPVMPFSLCLVADGMGGHHAGHEASRTVAHKVGHYVLERVYLPLVGGHAASTRPMQDIMLEAADLANQAIHNPDPDKEGGTTLTAALIIGRRLFMTHIGDSRGYLLDGDDLKLLTTDHSVVQRLQEAGHITAEQAAVHPHRNLLYRALTGNELEVDTYTRALPRQGMMLLCSDGLWGSIEDDEIALVMKDETISLHERCEKLVSMALTNGSTDNVTAVLIKFRL